MQRPSKLIPFQMSSNAAQKKIHLQTFSTIPNNNNNSCIGNNPQKCLYIYIYIHTNGGGAEE